MTADRNTQPKPSVCFVAPEAFAVLASDTTLKIVGGAEVQQSILAREFVRRGYRVSMVCRDHGQPPVSQVDGVTVIRAHRAGAGIPKLKTALRYFKLWRAMARANADVYYQQNAGALTGLVMAFARYRRKLGIFTGAHDMDFDPSLPLIPPGRDRALYRWGLKHASAVVVQSPVQRVACRRHFSLESTLIRSCYDHRGLPGRQEGVILWVANVKPHKRPELFVELARRLPAYQFRLVGGGSAGDEQAIQSLAAHLPNLELTGFVPFAEVEPCFDGAAVFVNTSVGEGFPNTFLQSWSRGIPTVSFFDPDCAVEGRQVGIVVHTIDQMADALRRLKEEPDHWRQHAADANIFFNQNFEVGMVVDDYERLFASLASPRVNA
jgi:glycosyltransferase involved in cell wall biosynthesis